MSTSKKETVRGKRYTPEEKSKIVAFVEDYNASNGRGGQSSASKKFGISQLTISTWLKGSSKAPKAKKAVSKNSTQNKLTAMVSLGQEIEKLENELEKKRSKFDSLKASL